jgi:adenine-specific DNA-methyltransferase
LIYIDPPFDTGADFSFTTEIPGSEHLLEKEASVLEQKAYRDTWGKGLGSYLPWFYDGVTLLRELLSESGTLYVHLDWHVGHYAKIILDEIFGPEMFRNDITWWYRKWSRGNKQFLRNHDSLLFYSKGESQTFNIQRVPLAESTIKRFGGKRQEFADEDRTRKVVSDEESQGAFMPDVWDVNSIPAHSAEKVGYATQKPEALLDRIVRASSNEHDLVLDCFCGSGTTAAVAEKLNRRWIACDLGRFAIHTTRKRLLGIPGVKPFVVQNLGKYERQAWQVAEFASDLKGHGFSRAERVAQENRRDDSQANQTAATVKGVRNGAPEGTPLQSPNDALKQQREREAAYRKFILELYHATPVSGHVWLHGVKGGRMVHVGAVDAPVTRADVNAIAAEVWKSKSAEKPAVDILGWEFALELNETAKEVAAQARVDAAFKKIPREVLEKKAVEQGDVHFFELGALSVETKIKKREVTLKLSDFVIPLDDVPAEVRSAIKHWSQMVDYWAVDWDFKDDTFHNQWQSYRTRKNPKLELSKEHEYSEPGRYLVVVKVIDILGNDTTKTLEVEIK